MGINKQELIGKIHGIEGLSNEEKSALIELLKTHKKYGLVWEDKPEDVEERLRDELPVLTEVKERAIISEDPDAPNHILIEGDNLEALTALSYTHAGKIDVIYIDPPYNTGNKDFVYNDTFVDSEDSFRHSKWLSFMSRRLMIAKQLLSNQGVIFISIDFHELPNMLLLGNDIFGESNFLANISVKGNPRGRQSSMYFAQVNDALLVYRKSTTTQLQGFNISDETSRKRFSKTDPNGRAFEEWELRKRGADSRRIDSPNLWFPIYCNLTTREISTERITSSDVVITPKLSNGEDGRWRWSREKVEKDKAALYVRETRSGFNVFERKYPESKSKQLAPTIWDYSEVNTELGTKLLKEIVGNNVPFDYPKPIGLIKLILQLVPNINATVLDFFAGSGTTLHATMQLNAEDGGSRRCILVTNNENNICEEVTYERNKRVINGYVKPNGEEVDGLIRNTLRYYKTDFVGRERSSQNMRQLVYAATDLLCIKEDLYNEVKQFGSLKLKSSVARYFEGKDKRMLVIYNELAVPAIADEIAKMTLSGKVKIYVFAPGNYAYDDEFFEVQNKVELCALPAAIYNAYQKVLPKRKTKLLDGVQEETEQVENNGELNLNFGEE